MYLKTIFQIYKIFLYILLKEIRSVLCRYKLLFFKFELHYYYLLCNILENINMIHTSSFSIIKGFLGTIR